MVKFGERLLAQQLPEWKGFYLDYGRLKRILYPYTQHQKPRDIDELRELSPTAAEYKGPEAEFTDVDETNFLHQVEIEYVKIETFYLSQLLSIRVRVEELQRNLDEGEFNRGNARTVQQRIEHLRSFSQLNKTALRKIMKKHDKIVGRRALPRTLLRAGRLNVFNPNELAAMEEKIAELLDQSHQADPGTHIAAVSDLFLLLKRTPMDRVEKLDLIHDLEDEDDEDDAGKVRKGKAVSDADEEPTAEEKEKAAKMHSAERPFRMLMIITAAALAFAHGSNDVANGVGPFAAMVEYEEDGEVDTKSSSVKWWILVMGGIGIVVGLLVLGKNVIDTIGERITKLTFTKGYSAQMATSITVMFSSFLGLPVSTTSTLVGGIVGVGYVRPPHSDGSSPAADEPGVDKVMVAKIVASWFATVVFSAIFTAGLYSAIVAWYDA